MKTLRLLGDMLACLICLWTLKLALMLMRMLRNTLRSMFGLPRSRPRPRSRSKLTLPLMLMLTLMVMLAMTAQGAPQLAIPDGRLGVAGAGVPVNVLINFSVTHEDAGAAYREPYQADVAYAGYFNADLCYQYPMLAKAGAVLQPDLGERSGYFAPSAAADTRRECRGDFSGNFLNWASSTTLDLLRYGLTGGDRAVDTAALTILQRAWLPDGRFHDDFYAHPRHFPRKVLTGGTLSSAPARVTPFATDKLYIVSCRDRILFSNTDKGGSCDAPRLGEGRLLASDKYFGEYIVRVKVCGADDAVLRPALCVRYGASYKPQGVLQAATQQIGVMGYLTDSAAPALPPYGGALRAPLKQLGNAGPGDPPGAGAEGRATSAANSNANANPNANAKAKAKAKAKDQDQSRPDTHDSEWHPRTGVLSANPDRGPGPVSGAIHYINRLGRADPARRGAYPRADPGAELFYESLRYLQGRAPTLTEGSALDDGLPVWRTRADPVALACQRNIVAVIGHTAFVDDRHVPGNTLGSHNDVPRASDTFTAPALDVVAATRRVGELEADAGGTPRADLLRLALLEDGPGGAGSFYLAGAAYWAHTNAIRPDMAARVDTFALEIGSPGRLKGSALYLAAKFGAFDDRNADGNPFVTTDGRRDNSEWSDAAGMPAHYVAATEAHALVPGLRRWFAGMGARGGAVAGATAAAGRFVIDTQHDPAHWSGAVQRRNFSVSADGTLIMAQEPAWDARALLDGDAEKAAAPRHIYTAEVGADGSIATVAFTWDSLSAPLRAYLDAPGPGLPGDARGRARVDYLRGARDAELGRAGGIFRPRASVLGDIIHSTPLVVGPPSASVQATGYAQFRKRHATRPSVVYVGANDGMLHAFDATDGRELFAYIPHVLLPALSQLTDPAYRHRAYVDASAGQGEAFIGGQWRSVLASGMGMGARGVFALDITDPASFDSGMNALWEFTDADDAAMGHVRTTPLVARLRNGEKDGQLLYRYFVVVSSGINPAAANGAGTLFLLALDKPATEKWRHGFNYFKIGTSGSGSGSEGEGEGRGDVPNALSPPVLAIAADGSARYAYAGDLHGHLWRFTFGAKPAGGSVATPLFSARDSNGAAQPFAHAPSLVFAPGGGYLVLAGTGKFIEQSDTDAASYLPQSFYAIHDSLATPVARVAGRGALAARTLTGTGRYQVTGAPLDYSAPDAQSGWYFDFPHTKLDGERAAGPAAVRSGAIVFDTLLPGADACTGTASRSYAIDALTGFAYSADGVAQVNATTGELTGPSVAQLAPMLIEMSVGSEPRTPTGGAVAIRTLALVRLLPAGKGVAVRRLKVAFQAKRLSWREVANWQDLHDAAKK